MHTDTGYWRVLYSVLAALLLLVVDAQSTTQASRQVQVAVLQSGPGRISQALQDTIEKELNVLLEDKTSVTWRYDPEFNVQWEPTRLRSSLKAALDDPSIDVVFSLSMPIAQMAMQWPGGLQKPVVSGYFSGQLSFWEEANEIGHTTVPNFTFAAIPNALRDDLELYHKMLGFNTLHLVIDESAIAIDEQGIRSGVVRLADELGFRVELIAAKKTAMETLRLMGPAVQAIYMMPIEGMSEVEYQHLINAYAERGIPTFSYVGLPDVQRGVLAGQNVTLYPQVARRLALSVAQIIDGEPPEKLSVFLHPERYLVVNKTVAKRIGVHIPFDVMLEADVIVDDGEDVGRALSLFQSMAMARCNNQNIKIKRAEVVQACEQRQMVRGAMYPHVKLKADYLQLDRDRVVDTLGLLPHTRLTYGAQLRQMLFDDTVLSAYRAEGQRYCSELWDEEAVGLDVMEGAGQYFLDYLATRSLYRIEQENFKLIRSNLELARLRVRVGTSGPEEVLRWEMEEAQRRSAIYDREVQMRQALALLNQSLGVPQTTYWLPEEIDPDKSLDPTYAGYLPEIVHNVQRLEEFKALSVGMALEGEPTLKAVERQIDGQRILLGQACRERHSPRVYAVFDYDHVLHERHPGKVTPCTRDGEDWAALVSVELPILQGGTLTHRQREAKAALRNLCHQRTRLEQIVETRVISCVYSLASSYPKMHLSRAAADYARKNLEIVRSNYAAGSANIIDLLDAQSQALIQEENAVLAVTQYHKDLLTYQRSVAQFHHSNESSGSYRPSACSENNQCGGYRS